MSNKTQNNNGKVYAPIFGKVKAFSNGGEIWNISAKADELVKFINDNKNAGGYININLSKQRNDETKLSASLDTFEPKKKEDHINLDDNTDDGLPF